MRASRRVVASLLTVAMLAFGPLGVPRSCSECPPGCPMHAQAERPPGATRQPGCHRTAEPLPADMVCLRSACGHDAVSESALATMAVPSARVSVPLPAPGRRLAAVPTAVGSAEAPEPPVHPPRTARG